MTDSRQMLEVSVGDLTAHCDPGSLPFNSTDDLHAVEAVFGQERAVRAIEFALGMQARGYNLYVSGPDGLGKYSIVESFLRHKAKSMSAPPDWVYVHNFEDRGRPIAIMLSAGDARSFAETMKRTVDRASIEMKQAFDADSYVRQRAELVQGQEQQRTALLKQLQQSAEQLGFALQMTSSGITSAPIIGGQPASDEIFNALTQEQQEQFKGLASEQLEPMVQDSLLAMRGLERDTEQRLEQLDKQVAIFAIQHLFESLLERYQDLPRVHSFIEAVRDDMQKERDLLRGSYPDAPQLQVRSGPDLHREVLLRRYEVNALICNDASSGAPVISESNPSYMNLLGVIESLGQGGAVITDHTMIRAGSLARASGGYLILKMRDLIQNTGAYEGLKRALQSGDLAIENFSQSIGIMPALGLRPEPLPINTKVVIVGDPGLYSYLFRADPDFRELFRVKADFEVDFERTPANIIGFSSVVRNQCDRLGMPCFTGQAIARLIEHSSRQVQDQRRLSGNIGSLLDLARQSEFWGSQEGALKIEQHHVDRALEEHEYRSALVRDRMQQMIDDGTIYIDTDGEKVGQINALSVYDLGDITFGRPSRITCITSAGGGAIINVERETNMAGRTHNKGFLILRGFLADRFGQDKAMAMHASLTFEQLYGDIDGDSASSTELYALLSSLAGIPISQSIAVTGSLNQRGEIQPIGGATAKIEGFFEVCRSRGLDGTQGVMIPRANVPNVVLRPEVAKAIEEGQFHVWAVDTIEEGIEVLTGVSAGEPDESNGLRKSYPITTIFGMVQAQLDNFANVLKGGPAVAGEATMVPIPQSPLPPVPGVPPPTPPEPPIEV